MVDGDGVPLASRVSGANVHDVCGLLPTVVACPLGDHGTRERLPERLYGDRAYGSAGHEGILRWLGVEPVFARPRTPHGSGLGRYRYVVERTLADIHQNRRLRVRYERRDDIHQAFLTLACVKLCWYRLDPDRN
jgi:transposase InsO family protein